MQQCIYFTISGMVRCLLSNFVWNIYDYLKQNQQKWAKINEIVSENQQKREKINRILSEKKERSFSFYAWVLVTPQCSVINIGIMTS